MERSVSTAVLLAVPPPPLGSGTITKGAAAVLVVALVVVVWLVLDIVGVMTVSTYLLVFILLLLG